MSDARALYQAAIVEHDRAPRHHGPLAAADAVATIDNPLCGDEVTVYVRRADSRLDAVTFEARGCALCRAAGSMMTARVHGTAVDEARALAARFEAFVRRSPDAGDAPDEVADAAALGDLHAFIGVRAFRSRQTCALLPFRALLAALEG